MLFLGVQSFVAEHKVQDVLSVGSDRVNGNVLETDDVHKLQNVLQCKDLEDLHCHCGAILAGDVNEVEVVEAAVNVRGLH